VLDVDPLATLSQACVLLLIIGLLYRLVSWLLAPRSRGGLTGGSSSWPRALYWAFLDLVLMRKALKADFYRGLAAWLMHILVLVLLLGHARAFGAWSSEAVPEPLRPMFIEVAPAVLGWLLFACLVFLLARRLSSKLARSLFTLHDAALYALLLTAVFAGNLMRLLPSSHEPFTWSPLPGLELRLEHTPNPAVFTVHVAAVSLLVAYLPFSPLIHVVAGVASSLSYYRWRLLVESSRREG